MSKRHRRPKRLVIGRKRWKRGDGGADSALLPLAGLFVDLGVKLSFRG